MFYLRKVDTRHIQEHLKEHAVGKRGEEWAWLYLRSVHGDAAVNWTNGGQETGAPYDITVHHTDGRTQYIEVKATKEVSFHRFVASHNELVHARNNWRNTEFYFVVNVQADTPQLYHVTNWHHHWALQRTKDEMPKGMRFDKELLAPLSQFGYDASWERWWGMHSRPVNATPVVLVTHVFVPVSPFDVDVWGRSIYEAVSDHFRPMGVGPSSRAYNLNQQMIQYHVPCVY